MYLELLKNCLLDKIYGSEVHDEQISRINCSNRTSNKII